MPFRGSGCKSGLVRLNDINPIPEAVNFQSGVRPKVGRTGAREPPGDKAGPRRHTWPELAQQSSRFAGRSLEAGQETPE
jgi:hypothetical protein